MASPEFDFYRIRSPAWHRFYWSNADGWVDRDSSDLFSHDEKENMSLPMYGEWVGVMYDKQYHCEECDTSWSDTWTCACNDRCPSCDAEIEPNEYKDFDADDD